MNSLDSALTLRGMTHKEKLVSSGHSIYPPDWKQTSKHIRERDGYTCQWCGAQPNNVGVAHLNHEPMDCRDENLLTLCWSCHSRYDGKTGANHPGKQERRRATIERNRKAKQEAMAASVAERRIERRMKQAESVKRRKQEMKAELEYIKANPLWRLRQGIRYTNKYGG